MGIFRPNFFLLEEWHSPGDLRFRIETDIRLPRTPDDKTARDIREALDGGNYEGVHKILTKVLREVKPQREYDIPAVQKIVDGTLLGRAKKSGA